METEAGVGEREPEPWESGPIRRKQDRAVVSRTRKAEEKWYA
jgi:hypothetical protein